MRRLITAASMAAFAAVFATACTSQDEPNTLVSQSSAPEATTEYSGLDGGESEDIFYYDPDPQPECYAEGSVVTNGEAREIGDGAIVYGYSNHVGFGDAPEGPMSYLLQVYPDGAHVDFMTIEITPAGHGGWMTSSPSVFVQNYLSEDLERFYFHGSMQEDGSGGSFEATFVSESSGQEVEVIIASLSCVDSVE